MLRLITRSNLKRKAGVRGAFDNAFERKENSSLAFMLRLITRSNLKAGIRGAFDNAFEWKENSSLAFVLRLTRVRT